MHKYERLEKIYYKKRYLKIFFVISVFLVTVGIGLFFKNTKKSEPVKKTVSEKKVKKSIKKDLNVSENKKRVEIKKEIKKKDVKKENNKIQTEVKSSLSFTLPLIKIDENKRPNKPKKNLNVKNNTKIKKTLSPKKPLIIEEKMNIKDLINSFNQNPDYETAIQISNYYLNKNKFDLAKLWALKANNINPSKADSWKIFAIILIKQKKLNKAKEVLNIYLNDYGENPEIKKLLRSINE